ncbi:clathrin heavy chain 1-like isoform X2 [Dermacentor andersoni]|uniref:clathrin heavy chain 1-like isoform X2 n=1 Tax=Dermacentor andersoni TaxID=34620 RepID=UPI0021552C18|nr:clathrin heavy chain 1-like isoform X2 [Dermacentor andersoni]
MSAVRKKSTADPKSVTPSLCVTELVQLTQLGIPLEHVTWPRVTVTPSQWLCIRHTMTCRNASSSADRCSVVTVFNPQRSAPQTYKVEARCAKLNPDKPLLAITDQWALYLYSTRTKKLLHKSRLERDLVYWAWVTPSTLGLVTRDAVFHWDCSSAPTEPVFMFSLHERIRNTELVGYITDPGLKWLAVTGLFQEEQVVSGLVQLYSVDRRVSQLLPGQCAQLCRHQFQGQAHASQLLLLADRGPAVQRPEGRLHLSELGPPASTGGALRGPIAETLEFFDPLDKFDFPVCLQVSSSQGLVYVLTKCGVVHLCDLETVTPLCLHVVCPDITFTASITPTCGLMVVSRNGQVLLVEIKKAALLRRIIEVVNRPAIATRLRQTLP